MFDMAFLKHADAPGRDTCNRFVVSVELFLTSIGSGLTEIVLYLIP